MAPITPQGPYPPNATSWWTRTKEQIRALKLKVKGEDMSGPRKGLYDDRPDDIKEIRRVKAETMAFNGHIEDLDKWVNSLEDGQLNTVLAYLTKKEMEELKKKMPKEEIIYNPHGEYDGLDLGAGKGRAVYTYTHDGRVDTLDLHDAPMFMLVYWRDKFKATREELEKQGMPNKIKPRQLWEAEINGLKSMEADLEEQIRISKAVSAAPHKWPEPEAYKEEERKFQKTVGAMPHYLSATDSVHVAQNANYQKLYGSQAYPERGPSVLPKRFSEGEQKKMKYYKTISLFCKVFSVICLIYIGLIIMENILVGKPISTYLNRVLTGE